MAEQATVRELLLRWLNAVMADKVMFTAIINNRLTTTIGLEEISLNDFVRIIRPAAKALVGAELTSGRVSNILIEKHGGLWKIVVFKQHKQDKSQLQNTN